MSGLATFLGRIGQQTSPVPTAVGATGRQGKGGPQGRTPIPKALCGPPTWILGRFILVSSPSFSAIPSGRKDHICPSRGFTRRGAEPAPHPTIGETSACICHCLPQLTPVDANKVTVPSYFCAVTLECILCRRQMPFVVVMWCL